MGIGDSFGNDEVKYDCNSDEIRAAKAFDFSKAFFKKSVIPLIDKEISFIEQSINELSNIYKDIYTFTQRSVYKKEYDCYNCGTLSSGIFDVLHNVDNQLIPEQLLIRITSKVGSYKELFLQYVYLWCSKVTKNILPIYINFSKYTEKDLNIDELTNILKNDIESIKKICKDSDKCCLFILDGVDTFLSVEELLFEEFKNVLDNDLSYVLEGKYKLILSVNTDFTDNDKLKRQKDILYNSQYKYHIRINQMRLDRGESCEFFQNSLKFFNKKDEFNADKLRAKCIGQLELITLDLATMFQLLNYEISDSISDFYSNIVLMLLEQSDNDLDIASEWAYKYELENEKDIIKEFKNFYNNNRKIWLAIKKHRNILDYLIARHYVLKLKSLEFTNLTEDKIKFINVVFTKKTNRFIIKMLNNIPECEEKLLELTDRFYFYYSNNKEPLLDVFGKSELAFLLGRLSAKNRDEAITILTNLKNKQTKIYFNVKHTADKERKKNEAFLLRCISVSLIHYNDTRATNDFLYLILCEKIFNDINKGFHIEYYDDVPLKLRANSNSLLGFNDDKSKGINTFRAMTCNLDREKSSVNCVFVYDLMTYCNLIQARKPSRDINNKVLDISEFKFKCIEYIGIFKKSVFCKELSNLICDYFNWIENELTQDEYVSYTETKMYNRFYPSTEIGRTGWQQRKIEVANLIGDAYHYENITEHMYNCWLMGLLYLPENIDEVEQITEPYNCFDEQEKKDYNKQAILNMLLIHDIAETINKDISRDEKCRSKERQELEERKENEVMHNFLLMCTYPFVNATISEYLNHWEQWKAQSGKKSINAKIAKDIDNIQAVYQYCKYISLGKFVIADGEIDNYYIRTENELYQIEKNSIGDFYQWIGEIDEENELDENGERNKGYLITTKIGKLISRKAIFENTEFINIIEKYTDLKNRKKM